MKGKSIGGLLFVAFMFIGMGLGMVFNSTGSGVMIGMGVGFLAMALVEKKKMKIKIGISKSFFKGIFFITGIWLIIYGILMTIYPDLIYPYLIAFGLISLISLAKPPDSFRVMIKSNLAYHSTGAPLKWKMPIRGYV